MTISEHDPSQICMSLLPAKLAVCQLPSSAAFPTWMKGEDLLAVVKTRDELSIVCDAECVPEATMSEASWRCWKVHGPLNFSLVGVVSGISNALAEAQVSIFVVSTYDTDYILVKEADLSRSREALIRKGYRILDRGDKEAHVSLSS